MKDSYTTNFTHQLKGHSNPVWALTQFQDKILSGSLDGTIKLWNPLADSNNYIKTFVNSKTAGSVYSLLLLQNNQLAIGYDNKLIKILDLESGEYIRELKGHEGCIYSLASLNESGFVSQGGDGTLRIWDQNNGSTIRTITDVSSYVSTVIVNDGYIISENSKNEVGIWSVEKGQLVHTLEGHPEASELMGKHMRALSFLPDKKWTQELIGIFPIYPHESDNNNVDIPDVLNDKSTLSNNTKYFYYFKGKDDYLECSIRLPVIDSHITPFLESIEVLDINKLMSPEIIIDYLSSELHVLFKKVINEKYVNVDVTLQFIRKLQAMGLPELHENKNALWFYSNDDGLEILNDLNYTKELKEFLKYEKELFTTCIKKVQNYSILIEVGCGIGENLDIATSNKLNYIGLDFSANKIIKFRKKLETIINQTVDKSLQLTAKCLNVMDFLDKEYIEKLPQDGNKVIIFPFNVFGNIAPISLLLSKLKTHNMDFLISIYKNDPKTVIMRKEYYKNCGYKKIEMYEDEFGSSFQSSEGLYTIAYNEVYLSNLIKAFGFNVDVSQSEYGLVFHGRINKIEKINKAENLFSAKSYSIDTEIDYFTKKLIEQNASENDQNKSKNSKIDNIFKEFQNLSEEEKKVLLEQIKVTQLNGSGDFGEEKPIDHIDPHFGKYTLDTLNHILTLRINDLQLKNTKILQGIFIDLQSNNISDILSQISNSIEKTILVPLNLSNKHAVGLIFEKGEDNIMQVKYLDSLNKHIPQVLKVLIINTLGSKVIFQETTVEQQKYANCGPEVIENFILCLTGTRVRQEKSIELHSKLVEKTLLNIESRGVHLLFEESDDSPDLLTDYLDQIKQDNSPYNNIDYNNLQLEVSGDVT